MPLPAWFYLITTTTIAAIAISTKYNEKVIKANKRRSRASRVFLGPADADAIKDRPWVRNSIVGVYYALIAGVIGLESVEVVRLFQSDQGIGLSPFVYGGCLLAVALRATKGFKNQVPGWQSVSQLFWLGSAVVTIIKVVAVGRMLVFPNGRFAREDTAYPTEQQLIVQVVLFVLYLGLLTLETIVQFVKPGYTPAMKKLKELQDGQNGIEMMAGANE